MLAVSLDVAEVEADVLDEEELSEDVVLAVALDDEEVDTDVVDAVTLDDDDEEVVVVDADPRAILRAPTKIFSLATPT